MEEVIVLEILERSGKVRERVRLVSFPVTIGRAYDNDIILDDEYVSPRHLTIERDEQGVLRAVDLNSENGLYEIPSLKRVDALSIATDNQLLVGSTHIRIRRTDFAVAPTALANRRRKSVQNTLASGRLFVPILLAEAGVLLMNKYFQTFQKIKYQEMIQETISPVLVLMIWAGIWAFIGRILGHRAAFFAHANMVLLALLSIFGLDWFTGYYSFSFSATASTKWIEALALTLIGGVLLYGHLHLATQLRPKKVAITSGLVAVGLLGITLFSNHVKEAQFNSRLSYPAVLKPASGIAGRPLSPEVFFFRAEVMKQQLDKARLEDN
jgi:hypothetical protein